MLTRIEVTLIGYSKQAWARTRPRKFSMRWSKQEKPISKHITTCLIYRQYPPQFKLPKMFPAVTKAKLWVRYSTNGWPRHSRSLDHSLTPKQAATITTGPGIIASTWEDKKKSPPTLREPFIQISLRTRASTLISITKPIANVILRKRRIKLRCKLGRFRLQWIFHATRSIKDTWTFGKRTHNK